MQKTIPIMKDLHSISSRIAENTRQVQDAANGNQNAVSAPASEPAPAPVSVPVAAPAETHPPIPAADPSASAMLKRRYEDFLRNRRDLLERLQKMESRLSVEGKHTSDRLNVIRSTDAMLKQILGELPPEEPGREAFSDRSELTDVTLKLENLRVQLLRLTPIVEDGASEPVRSMDGMPKKSAETGILLDSLSFRQIFRSAFIASLPVQIAILISALIIAFAMIGSFKGLF